MANASEQPEVVPAVSGIQNIGNTCYLNASLQSMASSPRLVQHVVSLAEAMKQLQHDDVSSKDPPGLAAQVLAGLQATYHFLVEGPDDADVSVEFLTARAAQGHLTQQLAAILAALQPQDTTAAQTSTPSSSSSSSSSMGIARAPSAVYPGGLLSCLSWYTPQGVLERGYQHDAAEAFEAVMDAVITELVCWHKCYNNSTSSSNSRPDQQQCTAAGLKQLVQPCTEDISQQMQWPPEQQHQGHHPVVQHTLQMALQHRGCCERCKEPSICSTSSSAGCLDRPQPSTACLEHHQLQQQLSAEHAAVLHSRLPVIGHTVDLITCCKCGYRFPRSLTPFVSLPLPLSLCVTPPGQLSVSSGADLDWCLRRYGQPEVVEGVECLKCSITASLAAAATAHGQRSGAQQAAPADSRPGSQQPTEVDTASSSGSPAFRVAVGLSKHSDQDLQQQQQQQQLLSRLHQVVSSSSPLPPLDYQQSMQQAGLPWMKCRGAVLKQTRLARPPPVLVLQLQRSMHTQGGMGKVQGHVRFPMWLDLSQYVHVDEQQRRQQEGKGEGAVGKQDRQGQLRHANEAMKQVVGGQPANSSSEALQQQDAGPALQQQQCTVSSVVHQLLYQCTAVIQHLGGGQASGHYMMYRRATLPKHQHHQEEQQQQKGPPIVQGDGCCGSSSSSVPGPDSRQHYWLRVNDSSVTAVHEQEVLQCHATLLLYERCS